jgi:hypothetical protein
MEAKYSPFWKNIFLSGRYSNFEDSPQSPRVNLRAQRFKKFSKNMLHIFSEKVCVHF